MPLRFITITGADESVDPYQLLGAFQEPGRVELGVLWGGPEKEGRPRYPGIRWFRALEAAARRRNVMPQLALHLCARAERTLATWPSPNPIDPAAVLEMIGLPGAAIFRRIQMNRALGSNLPGREEFDAARMAGMGRVLASRGAGFVLQVRRKTAAVMEHAGEVLSTGVGGVSGVLLDASGGRGVKPERWEPADEPFLVGWAGGLNPGNLRAELDGIQEAAGGGAGSFWVDLESGVRSGAAGEDFSVQLARDAWAEAREWSIGRAGGR